MPSVAPPLTDEQELVLAYVGQQRQALISASFGLTEQQARLTPTVSALSIGGIIKHVSQTEGFWMDLVAGRYQERSAEEGFRTYREGMSLAENETLEGIVESYGQTAAETERIIREIGDLSQEVPVPRAPWFPQDVSAWTVRWVLLHVVEETARHAGHADIIREAIDGGTAIPLLAAAEGRPESDWVKPWKPSG